MREMKMLHNQMQKQLSAYLDDELSTKKRQRVKQHLLVCEECSSLLHELREMSDGVASLRQTAPEDLWFAISAQLEDASPDYSQRTLMTERRWAWRRIHPIIKPVAVTIGIALVALGVFIQIFLRGPSEISPEYTQMDAYLTAHAQYYSQNMLAPDPTFSLSQQQADTASNQQALQTDYDSEVDFYLSVYLGEDEI